MRIPRPIVGVVVAAAITAAVVSCGDHTREADSPVSSQSVPTVSISASAAPETPGAAMSVDEVARRSLTRAYTWYPGRDGTPNDAFGRARDWFTDALAQRFIVDARTAKWPTSDWAKWAAEDATVTADVAIGCSGCPPDTATVSHRVATIRQRVVTADDIVPIQSELVVWVTLVNQDGRWLLDALEY